MKQYSANTQPACTCIIHMVFCNFRSQTITRVGMRTDLYCYSGTKQLDQLPESVGEDDCLLMLRLYYFRVWGVESGLVYSM